MNDIIVEFTNLSSYGLENDLHMLRLKSRQSFIPNGFVFYLPEVRWKSPRMASFDTIVSGLMRVIKANPALAAKNKWPTDRASVEDWVDTYNATVCAKMGWNDYILTDVSGSIPKASAPAQSLRSLAVAAAKAKALVAGAKTLMEWDDSGDPPVDRDLATARASVCAVCPLNQQGNWTDWFTVPAADLIQRRIERAKARNLSTVHDEKLQLCEACGCPLRLKVHVPIDWIGKRLAPEQLARMTSAPACWVVRELESK